MTNYGATTSPIPSDEESGENTPLISRTTSPARSTSQPPYFSHSVASSPTRFWRLVTRVGLPILLVLLIFFISRSRVPVYVHSFAAPRAPHQANATGSGVPGSAPEASSIADSVRMFTYNVYVLPRLGSLSPHRRARLGALLPRLAAADTNLLCMQELYWVSGGYKAAFFRAGADRGLAQVAAAPALGVRGLLRWPPKLVDAGLSISSSRRVLKADYHIYEASHPLSIDFIVAKSVLYARLESDTPSRRPIHVFTTHLQADNGLDVDFAAVRARQLHELRAFIHRCMVDDPDGVIVLAGDFNVDGRSGSDNAHSSPEYKAMMRVLNGLRRPRDENQIQNLGQQNMQQHDYYYGSGNENNVTDSVATKFDDLVLVARHGKQPVTSAGGLDGSTQKNERLDYIFLQGAGASAVHGSVFVNQLLANRSAPYRTLSDHYAIQATIDIRDVGPVGRW